MSPNIQLTNESKSRVTAQQLSRNLNEKEITKRLPLGKISKGVGEGKAKRYTGRESVQKEEMYRSSNVLNAGEYTRPVRFGVWRIRLGRQDSSIE